MNNNFVISGFGRSGTTFLQQLMNRSGTWTVSHEPGDSNDFKSFFINEEKILPSNIEHRFKTYQYYGEVNSLLRYWLPYINVDKKGILIRNPENIAISIANRKLFYSVTEVILELKDSFIMFENWLMNDKSIKLIIFEKLVSDINYCQSIIEYFGIKDVKIDDKIFNKVINGTLIKRFHSVDDLPNPLQRQIKEIKKTYERIIQNGSA